LKEKYTVRAPFKGVVTQKLTDVGEWITQGQPIAEIVQLDPIELVVNAPQEQLQQIQESMVAASEGSPLTATIEFEGLDGPISGVVKSIVSQADLRSRTFPVRIEIDNQKIGNGYLLQPGMLGRATLTIGPKTEMLMIKKDALVLSSGRTKVFKVSSRGSTDIVVEVPVKTGSTSGDWIQVIGKLTTNDQVVLMGNERLRSGQEISISSSTEDTP
jgi:RND family efflux transporter MFP subunit